MTFVNYLRCAGAALLAVSCGAPTKRREVHAPDPVERLVEILERGTSLYGLAAGCGEWRAKPGPTEVVLAVDDDESAGGAGQANESTEVGRKARVVEGHLSAATPDAEGRIHKFSYSLARDRERTRMTISGRGWHPAPGVIIRAPGKEGFAMIGSASYCTYDVDLRAHPGGNEAILVGAETWFFSRDACMRSRSVVPATRGCPAPKKIGHDGGAAQRDHESAIKQANL